MLLHGFSSEKKKNKALLNGAIFFCRDTVGQGKDKALVVKQEIPSLVIRCPHMPFAPLVMDSQELAQQGNPVYWQQPGWDGTCPAAKMLQGSGV